MQIIWIKIWKLPSPYWKGSLKVIWPKTSPNQLCFGVCACLPLLCVLALLCAGRAQEMLQGWERRAHSTSSLRLGVCSCRNTAPNICSSCLPTRMISLVRVRFGSCPAWQNRPPRPDSTGQSMAAWALWARMITLSESGRRPKQSNS